MNESTWTGFALLLVPLQAGSVSPVPLTEQVRAEIATDVMFARTVRVTYIRPVDVTDPRTGAAVARRLVAIGGGSRARLFAPQVTFGCVVIGDTVEEAREAAASLARFDAIQGLPVHFYPLGARDESSVSMVRTVASMARRLMADFERTPQLVIDQSQFAAFAAHHHTAEPPAGSAASRPTGRQQAVTAILPWRRRLAEPARPQAPMGVVIPVYLALIDDSELQDTPLRNRIVNLTLDLDARLASAGSDHDGGPFSCEVTVFRAGRRLSRLVVRQPAGKLATRQITGPAQMVDMTHCLDELIETTMEDQVGRRRSRLTAAEPWFIFLSRGVPFISALAMDRMRRVSDLGRVSWIVVDRDRGRLAAPQHISAELREMCQMIITDSPGAVDSLLGSMFGSASEHAPLGEATRPDDPDRSPKDAVR